jgi:hypothetical protein
VGEFNQGKEREMERPEIVQDQHLVFLDELRESGVTNMFGAGPYLVETFGVSHGESLVILAYWMKSFSERHDKMKT